MVTWRYSISTVIPNQFLHTLIGYTMYFKQEISSIIHWFANNSQWTHLQVITFPAQFWPDKIIIFCHWLFTLPKILEDLRKSLKIFAKIPEQMHPKYMFLICRVKKEVIDGYMSVMKVC